MLYKNIGFLYFYIYPEYIYVCVCVCECVYIYTAVKLGVCGHIARCRLTYAHVCSRMLTYSDLCCSQAGSSWALRSLPA